MVKLLILYYLSLKSTHGYEIQKFIQLSKMDEWNNIKSGSIYYAMSKLEKNGLIKLISTIGNSEKSKRIYAITEEGRQHLTSLAIKEMQKPLGNICSEKFLVYPILANLTKEELTFTVNTHIEKLTHKLKEINDWTAEKNNTATEVEKATLKLMKETVQNQITWHNTLLENIDEAIEKTQNISHLIKTLDFSNIDSELSLNIN